jgi:hypothetical protein
VKKQYRLFEDAREFVHSLNIQNNKGWRTYCNSGIKPENIPSNPDSVYKNKNWTNWGDFLGTGRIATSLREHRRFEDAREFVHSLKLKNQEGWAQFCRSGNKPKDIPQSPIKVYKKEFKGFGDWLGTGTIAPQVKAQQWLTYDKAKKIIHSLGLKSKNDWDKFCKSNKKPENIPSNPNRAYKKEWKGWGDWTGTGTIAPRLRKYRSFNEAREFVHSLEFKNQKTWLAYSKSNKKPIDIPASPETSYKNKGWTSWGDWTGSGSIGPGLRKHRSFEDAREFTHTLGLTGANEWRTFAKSNKLPNNIPKNPNQVYKDKGWTSWGDWTGTGIIATYEIKYRGYDDAREFARSLGLKSANEWRKFSKTGKFPKDIPYGPNLTYKNKGWSSWGDWLGTGTLSTQDISKNWLPWKEAKQLYQKIVKENNLTTKKQWQQYIKTHKLPKGLPPYPADIYTEERVRKMMR